MRSWLRRIGRGRIASAIPDSISLAMLGAATTVEPSARTPLNMKAITMVNCEAASRTSGGVSRAGAARRGAPTAPVCAEACGTAPGRSPRAGVDHGEPVADLLHLA